MLIETDLVEQLLRSLDYAIEQAKAQSSVERSQIAHVIQKQEDLRRATGTYRQEGSEANRAQLFVDYHDAYQAHIQLTQELQGAFTESAQEYQQAVEEAEVGAESYQRAVDEVHAVAEPYLKAVQEAQAGAAPYHEVLREAQAGTEARRVALKEAQDGAHPYHQPLPDATTSGTRWPLARPARP